jgi:hypothetical protein
MSIMSPSEAAGHPSGDQTRPMPKVSTPKSNLLAAKLKDVLPNTS